MTSFSPERKPLMTARSLAAVSLAVGALLFAGCTSAAPGGDATDPAVSEIELAAGWLDGGRTVAVVTWGSSSCVPIAEDVTLGADGTVAVELGGIDPAAVCTADFAPRATLVGLPDGVEAGDGVDLVVTLDDVRGEIALGAYAGGTVAEFSPSAGWVADDLFAILTWGSSSCAPVIETVEETSATEVSVVFADLGERACTMDMAPRVVLAGVADVSHDGATVTLSGGDAEFAEPVTLPIS